MTTLQEVLAWHPEGLATAARGIGEVGDEIHAVSRGLTDLRSRLSGGWQGVAADSALRAIGDDLALVREMGRCVDTAEQVLQQGSLSLTTARDTVRAAVAAAERDGCVVRPDGVVEGPPVPPDPPLTELPPMWDPFGSSRAAARSQELATRHAAAIHGALQAAADADATVAGSVSAIQVPQNQDILTAQLDRTTGGAASRAQDAKDLYGDVEKVVLAGTGAVAYGAFLRHAATAARTSRALDAAGDPLEVATAFHTWLDASGAVARDLAKFKAGDTPLWYEAVKKAAGGGEAAGGWVSTGAKVLGKVSLVLTVYEGVKDTATGGGHDGTRGTTTRVLGALGAAGATVLLASGTVAVAAPLLGAAALATTAYGLWSAGTLVYDNRDAIAETGRKAWGAVKGWFR